MITTLLARVGAVCADALSEALTLLLPITCAGCEEPDVALCEQCREALAPQVERRVLHAAGGPFEVWSGVRFEGVAARVVRAMKEDGRTGLAVALAPALVAASQRIAASAVIVIPMPTSRAAYRRRGFRLPELLARRAGLHPKRLLFHARRTADQRGLDRESRARNVAGSMVARDVRGCRVVLLDDVVTTGASLAEGVRALRAAGAEVVGAVTVAATPRRGAQQSEPHADAPQTHR